MGFKFAQNATKSEFNLSARLHLRLRLSLTEHFHHPDPFSEKRDQIV